MLEDQADWPRDRVLAAMNGPDTRRVDLKLPLRVVIFYLTAMVTPEDDSVHFSADIYGHDGRLERALASAARSRSRTAF